MLGCYTLIFGCFECFRVFLSCFESGQPSPSGRVRPFLFVVLFNLFWQFYVVVDRLKLLQFVLRTFRMAMCEVVYVVFWLFQVGFKCFKWL